MTFTILSTGRCGTCGPLHPKVGWQNVGKSSPPRTDR
jgi:hypothetical protein